MARSTPQSFQKRQRERRNQEKAAEKLERRLIRSEEKRRAKAGDDWQPTQYVERTTDEDGWDDVVPEEGAAKEGASEESTKEGDPPQAE